MSKGLRFGHAGYGWTNDSSDGPCKLAAAYLQHRVIVAARERLGDSATTREFAAMLGNVDSSHLKRVQRLLANETRFGIEDLLLWCHIFSIDLGHLMGVGIGDDESLPSIYRSLVDVQPGKAPTFRSAAQINWRSVTDTLGANLALNTARIPTRFLGSEVVTYELVKILVESGVPHALIRDCEGRVEILSRPPQSITVSVSCRGNDEEWSRTRHAVVIAPDADIAIRVWGETEMARANDEFPGLLDANVGQSFEVPLSALEGESFLDDQLTPITWDVMARISIGDATLLADRFKRAPTY